MFEYLRQDYQGYLHANDAYPRWRARLNAFGEYGFLATCVYRYGRWTLEIRPQWLSYPFKLIYIILHTLSDILFGISVSTKSDIGPGFYIGHFSCIFVHGKLGRNCSIGQGVTIGAKGAGKSNGYPEIGDNVYIGAGAKIIGRIRIGNDVVIGANAVVVKDVPDCMRVVGNPATISPIQPPQRKEGDDSA